MSTLINSLLALPGVRIAIFAILGILALLYILSIIWVARDSYLRGGLWVVWTLVAIIPLVGVVAYCLLRPSLFQIDRDEQELEIALKKRELLKYGQCGNCGYPVEADYIICPNCMTKLKNMCPTCGRALDPSWQVCPYCGTEIIDNKTRTSMVPVSRADMALAPVDTDDLEYEDLDDDLEGFARGAHAQ